MRFEISKSLIQNLNMVLYCILLVLFVLVIWIWWPGSDTPSRLIEVFGWELVGLVRIAILGLFIAFCIFALPKRKELSERRVKLQFFSFVVIIVFLLASMYVELSSFVLDIVNGVQTYEGCVELEESRVRRAGGRYRTRYYISSHATPSMQIGKDDFQKLEQIKLNQNSNCANVKVEYLANHEWILKLEY